MRVGHNSILDRQARVEQVQVLGLQYGKELLGLFVTDDEFDEYRHIPGKFEKMLLVQAAVSPESGHRAKCRAAVDVQRFCMFQ